MEVAGGYVLVIVYCLCSILPLYALATMLTLPLAIRNIRTMMQAEPLAEAPIGGLDQQTAQCQLLFGLLFTLSFVVASLTTS